MKAKINGMEFLSRHIMKIKTIKKKGFALSIIAFPVMLLNSLSDILHQER